MEVRFFMVIKFNNTHLEALAKDESVHTETKFDKFTCSLMEDIYIKSFVPEVMRWQRDMQGITSHCKTESVLWYPIS